MLHSLPLSSGRLSAVSAIRRSPGGTMPGTSRRSRPEDPPSSATVTTAVMSTSNRTSALSMTCRPCPPPRATTRGRRLSVIRYSRPRSRCTTWIGERISREPPAQLLRDRHAAVLAAGAADSQRQVALAFSRVTATDEVDQLDVPVEELPRAGLGEHVVGDRSLLPRQVLQLGNPERVRQEAHIDDEIGVQRQPVLVAERDDGQRAPPLGAAVLERVLDLPPQLVHRHARRCR